MTYPSLAIIGTAGRKEDKRYLKRAHHERMAAATIKLLSHLKIDTDELKVYSGGAAWADHLVVTLALVGAIRPANVTLFLPTAIGENGFVGTDEKSNKTADTANYYHRMFSHEMGFNSIQQILGIGDMGAKLEPGTGNFFQRNSSVAKAVSPDGLLLAYTFGAPDFDQDQWSLKGFDGAIKAIDAGLKDGGTADTFNKATCRKWHGKIGEQA